MAGALADAQVAVPEQTVGVGVGNVTRAMERDGVHGSHGARLD
jgi:hypothetical protein